jgi:hypothetical protein
MAWRPDDHELQEPHARIEAKIARTKEMECSFARCGTIAVQPISYSRPYPPGGLLSLAGRREGGQGGP